MAMDGFRELYERYYPDVYRFALFLTGDVARAEDLAADTFARAWTARDRIRQETVRAYLLTITRNLFRDHLRTARPHVTLDERVEDGAPTADVRVERAFLAALTADCHSPVAALARRSEGQLRAILYAEDGSDHVAGASETVTEQGAQALAAELLERAPPAIRTLFAA